MTFKGHRLSKTHKDKLRLVNLGNKYTLGFKHSEATKELIRQSRLGKKASPETRRRMSISNWRRRKAEEKQRQT
jgi:hypothetical protein